jgi:hypothetical protein
VSICHLLLALGAARGGSVLGRSDGGDSARERKGTSGRDGRFGGQRITGMSEPATTAPSPAGAGSPTDDVLRWERQMVEEVAAVRGAGGGAARWRGRHDSARAQAAGLRVGGEGMEDGKA